MTKEIDVFSTGSVDPAAVFSPGGVEPIIAAIAAHCREQERDVSTKAGRDKVASLAYKISRSKTALDEVGKNHVATLKAQAAIVDTERRKAREKLDELRDEIRAPLDEWELSEKQRKEAIDELIRSASALSVVQIEDTSDEIRDRLDRLNEIDPEDFQEERERGEKVVAMARAALQSRLEIVLVAEEERRELERLRKEKEEAAAAAEAAIQEERDKAIAAAAAAMAEEKAKAAEEEAARLAAELEKAKEEGERRAREREEKAKADEIDRQRRQKEAEEEEARRREHDRENKRRIHGEILRAMVKHGLTQDVAKAVITAVAKKEIPHVTIAY